MANKLLKTLTSLKLTVALLALAMVLVFIGTLAQVKIGLYESQTRYFHSFFVHWGPAGASWKIPVFPGGYLLGTLLLINLLAAHITRFTFARKKTGIFLTHAGIILMLLGQLLTELFQVESNMRIEEGNSKNYSEDSRKFEVAVVDETDPKEDTVYAFGESSLKHGEIKHPELPFTLKVKDWAPNAWIGGPMTEAKGKPLKAADGNGKRFVLNEEGTVASMDDENKPSAVIQVVTAQGSAGEFLVSPWFSKHQWRGTLKRMGIKNVDQLPEAETFQVNGRTYTVALRPIRYYKPHTIVLHKFTHERYMGTDMPKDFASEIQVINPVTQENRAAKIYMNNPMRYGGETYYQSGFEPGDTVTVLQVVRNPAWLTPYLACSMVGLGLVVQFMTHLIGFAVKRRTAK